MVPSEHLDGNWKLVIETDKRLSIVFIRYFDLSKAIDMSDGLIYKLEHYEIRYVWENLVHSDKTVANIGVPQGFMPDRFSLIFMSANHLLFMTSTLLFISYFGLFHKL